MPEENQNIDPRMAERIPSGAPLARRPAAPGPAKAAPRKVSAAPSRSRQERVESLEARAANLSSALSGPVPVPGAPPPADPGLSAQELVQLRKDLADLRREHDELKAAYDKDTGELRGEKAGLEEAAAGHLAHIGRLKEKSVADTRSAAETISARNRENSGLRAELARFRSAAEKAGTGQERARAFLGEAVKERDAHLDSGRPAVFRYRWDRTLARLEGRVEGMRAALSGATGLGAV